MFGLFTIRVHKWTVAAQVLLQLLPPKRRRGLLHKNTFGPNSAVSQSPHHFPKYKTQSFRLIWIPRRTAELKSEWRASIKSGCIEGGATGLCRVRRRYSRNFKCRVRPTDAARRIWCYVTRWINASRIFLLCLQATQHPGRTGSPVSSLLGLLVMSKLNYGLFDVFYCVCRSRLALAL